MMFYKALHIRKLTEEAQTRFDRLMNALPNCKSADQRDTVDVHGLPIRMAVDDFKTILAEIRKLK